MTRLLACLAMALSCGFAAAQPWEAPTGPNVVRNPGFEEVQNGVPADWGGPPEVYSSDASVAHGGQRSLKFANADSGHYALCSQSISLEPGRAYEVRAWVRTRGIAGEDSGASVCVEWSDALGRYLGGCYPDGVKGDSEWAEIVGLTPEMPPEAAHVTVSCYVRKGMTGTAWWDDVSVRLWAEEPLESVLVTPSYRGWVQSDTPGYARVRVRLRGEEIEGGAAAARVRLRLTACDSGEYVAETTVPGAEGDMNLQLPLPRLAPGRYWLDVDALDLSKRDKSRHCADRYALECRSGPLPKVYVDEHRRLIVDGKPFFPLGMYLSGLEAEQLRVYQEAPFNCLMPYQQPNKEEMDLLQGLGLKVIYTIKDYYAGTEWCPDWIKAEADEEPAVRKTVREFRDHPALLAWYLNDERPVSMLPKLEAHQRWVEEEDANHPTWVVLYQVEEIGKYIRTFDVIGADPYPIPSRPAAMAAQWTKLVRDGVAGSRAMWMVPQVFRWPRADRPPSLAEMRAMAWQCIAEGANGLIFYSWFDLWHDQQFPFSQRWPEVKQVAAEVAEMIPVLLSVEAAPEVTVEGPQALHWTARSYRGKGYLFLVNDSPGPISARVRFASPPKRVTRQGKEVEVARDGALAVTLGPLGVSVYEAEG